MAGDVIDASLGAALALSTMAAAGLGNAVSDAVRQMCVYREGAYLCAICEAIQ